MSTNMIPEVLTDYRVYDSDTNELMGVADVTLPDIEAVTTSIKGAGIGGEMEVPVLGHSSPMTISINWRTTEQAAMRLLAPDIHKLTFRAAIQNYNANNSDLVQNKLLVAVECRNKKMGLGKLSAGDTMDTSTEFAVNAIKVTHNLETIIEIDKLRNVFRVGGNDLLSGVNAALGKSFF